MKTKTIFCVGFRSNTSGGFDWYKESVDAAAGFAEAMKEYGSLENEPHDIVRFDVAVPARLTGERITEYIDEDLDAHMDDAIKRGGDMVVSALQAAGAQG
jgi:hypothetical protein